MGELTVLFHMSIGTIYLFFNPTKKEKVFCRPCIHSKIERVVHQSDQLTIKHQRGVGVP